MAIAFMHTAPRVLLRSIYNFIGLLFDVIVYLYALVSSLIIVFVPFGFNFVMTQADLTKKENTF